MGALAIWASPTRRTIWANAVSEPTRVVRSCSRPARLTVPPITVSPWRLETGRASPVSMDSSTCDWPLVTSPSAGMREPGRTCTPAAAGSGDARGWRKGVVQDSLAREPGKGWVQGRGAREWYKGVLQRECKEVW